MNRLILIGNGFDLAHGYKTSYVDFILAYLKQCFIKAANYTGDIIAVSSTRINDTKYNYVDELVDIKLKSKYNNINYEEVINACSDIKALFELTNRIHFTKVFKSSFIEETVRSCETLKWVDIENLYFQKLLDIKRDYLADKARFIKNSDKHYNNLSKLNLQLDYLTVKLREYLQSLDIDKDDNRIESLSNVINEDIRKQDVLLHELESDLVPENIYFLNFNYTMTMMKYVEPFSHLDKNYNYIHGELCNENSPMIFGFGDEIDKSYQEIEELNNNEYFKHIKSFKYFHTANYHNLIRFLDANLFQVYVMGHSCGLSDRTMLNQIFEHEKCVSIKIFYHQRRDNSNDYREKTFEISRHFKDKALMRKKIIPFEKSISMPQFEKHKEFEKA